MMIKLLFVFLGGGCGSVLRYLISTLAVDSRLAVRLPLVPDALPVGTLICNVVGCFLIGMFNALSARLGWSGEVRLLLTVGLCGGFTTFSTFSNECLSLLQSGNYMVYGIYLVLSVVLGLLVVLASYSAFAS